MDEFRLPALATPEASSNIPALLAERIARDPAAPILERKVDGEWTPITAEEFGAAVTAVAKGFIASGVNAGDRVAIMSKTRYEWTLLDFALWTAGAVPVPVYETSAPEQLRWILSDSGCSAVVVENTGHEDVLAQVRADLPDIAQTWTIDDGAIAALTEAGSEIPDDAVTARTAEQELDSTATIIYTSGTTGRPKGAELTHGNFVELSLNALAELGEEVCPPGSRTLLFMPLAHVFARFIGVLVFPAGAVMGHTPDTKDLIEDMGTFKPTFILSVPRVFEKVYNSAEQKAAADGKLKIFRMAAATAVDYSRALDDGKPGIGLRLRHALFDKLVYSKLRKILGGQVTHAISGGAPLGERLGHFFRGIGLIVLEGYGLTETTAPATVNTPSRTKIGTVGPPLPGTAVRIASDGEICLQGHNVMRGYWNDESATNEVLIDGWFHTGDVGELDEDGFLRITGRKKEIIVTAGGKNVVPATLEDSLRGHPLISQCMVVGDKQRFIAALITLDGEMLPTWLENNGKEKMDARQAAQDPDVLETIERAIERANKQVSRAESIREFRILDRDFTEEEGYLTPSLKLRRDRVLSGFADVIDEIYSGAAPSGDK